MWRDSKWMRVWNVLYPVGMYLVVSNIAMFILGLVMPVTTGNYNLRHCIVTVVAFPFVWSYYRHEPYYCMTLEKKRQFSPLVLLLSVGAGAGAAVFFNNLIAFTPLISYSAGYRKVSGDFYGSAVWLTILSTCILTPILEETLYRGAAYRRLRGFLDTPFAILYSALLFGAMHLNLVQFLYAGLLGLLLAWLMEHLGLGAAIAAHIGANLITVLRSSMGIFDFLEQQVMGLAVETILAAGLAVGCMVLLRRKSGT